MSGEEFELMEEKYPELSKSPVAHNIVCTCNIMRETLLQKNRDYGDSFEKTLEKYGDTALMLRLEDKWNRLESLFQNKENLVKDESFEDTVRDLAGYCLLYLAIRSDFDGDA